MVPQARRAPGRPPAGPASARRARPVGDGGPGTCARHRRLARVPRQPPRRWSRRGDRWRRRACRTACTSPSRRAAGPSSGPRSRTCSGPGWSCASTTPAESEVEAPRRRDCPGGPTRAGLAPDRRHCSPRRPRRRLADHRAGAGSPPPGHGPRRCRRCGCCPTRDRGADAARPGRGRRRTCCRSAWTRTDSRRCGSTCPATRTWWCTPTGSPGRPRCCAARPRSSRAQPGAGSAHDRRLPARGCSARSTRSTSSATHLEREALTAAVDRRWSALAAAAAARARRHPRAAARPLLVDRAGACSLLVDDYDLVAARLGGTRSPRWSSCSPRLRTSGCTWWWRGAPAASARAMFEPVLGPAARARDARPGQDGSRDEGPLVGAARPGPRPPGRAVLVDPPPRRDARAAGRGGTRTRRSGPASGRRRRCRASEAVTVAQRSEWTSASTASRRRVDDGREVTELGAGELAAVLGPDDGEALADRGARPAVVPRPEPVAPRARPAPSRRRAGPSCSAPASSGSARPSAPWLAGTVDRAAPALRGARPARLVLTHPASWGASRREVLRRAGCRARRRARAAVPSRSRSPPMPRGCAPCGAADGPVAVLDVGTRTARAAVVGERAPTLRCSPTGDRDGLRR